jgi:hypothetical protein
MLCKVLGGNMSKQKLLWQQIENSLRVKYLQQDERKRKRDEAIMERIFKKSFSHTFPNLNKSDLLVKQIEMLRKRNTVSAKKLYLVADRIRNVADDLIWTATENDMDVEHCKRVARDCAIKSAELMIPLADNSLWLEIYHPFYQMSFYSAFKANVGNLHFDDAPFEEVEELYEEYRDLLLKIYKSRNKFVA